MVPAEHRTGPCWMNEEELSGEGGVGIVTADEQQLFYAEVMELLAAQEKALKELLGRE